MNAELITKLTRIIILLVFIIFGLIAFILIDKMNNPKKADVLAVCGTVDSTSIKMASRAAYRYSANFINSDFNPEIGRNIFHDNCAMCHSLCLGNKIIGPALYDAFNHIPKEPKDWIFHYLQNSDSLASTGDKYVKGLGEQYPVAKWNHTDSLLSKENLIDVVGFIGMIK